MPLPMFENAIEGGFIQPPNDYFRDLQQEAINGLFDCTSAKYTIQEQDGIGKKTFHEVEAWLDYIVGTTSSGVKNGQDFTQLMFRDIDHFVVQGLYYIFDGNYHIGYFYNKYDGLEKALAVRRCNNFMRIVDPENGSIFSIPCVIDYDMASPSQQVSSYIITPNNHAVVMVQGNEDTRRLFKLNKRFMFNGRPFKLLAYQNTLNYDLNHQHPTLLWLDLYLDEIHDKDDIENNIAYNGEYNYTVTVDADDIQAEAGAVGTLTATVMLNGVETAGEVEWASSNERIVIVNELGQYYINGYVGGEAQIIAFLKGNENAKGSINVKVVEENVIEPVVLIDPAFTKIRQFESLPLKITVKYGHMMLDTFTDLQISLAPDSSVFSNDYITLTEENGQYIITANSIATVPQNLYITIQNDSPSFQVQQQFTFNVVSMFG